MVSYETIPADPAAEDGLLAKPKPKTSLKRIIGAAALTSFILGAVAATALSMPAGVPQTMLKGDPYCTNDNAPATSSKLSDKLNKAMNEGKKNGFIFRFRFDGQIPCDDDGYGFQTKSDSCGDLYKAGLNGGVAATVLSNQVHTENPVFAAAPDAYCIQNTGHGCKSASVGYALLDYWSMACRGSDCDDSIGGFAYFPTDANSVDGRDWKNGGGIPGQGCHYSPKYSYYDQQYLGDWPDLLTYDQGPDSPSRETYNCKCDINNKNLNFKKYADYLVSHIADSKQTTCDGDVPCVYDDKQKPLPGKLQPMYLGQDMSACWIPENEKWQTIFDMQNDLYDKRNKWWNGAVGQGYEDDSHGPYPGWNEIAFDYKIDLQSYKDKLEALVVVLPDGLESLCDFDKDVAQEVDVALKPYWIDTYGDLPVVIMKNTKEGGKYYKKEVFVQAFTFENGNCIYDNGDGYHYYKGDGC